jgi:hypothetical protein
MVGDKLTAFAKRCNKSLMVKNFVFIPFLDWFEGINVDFYQISCDFQWFNMAQNGIERMIPYETTASYVVKTWDIGTRLKVVYTTVISFEGF